MHGYLYGSIPQGWQAIAIAGYFWQILNQNCNSWAEPMPWWNGIWLENWCDRSLSQNQEKNSEEVSQKCYASCSHLPGPHVHRKSRTEGIYPTVKTKDTNLHDLPTNECSSQAKMNLTTMIRENLIFVNSNTWNGSIEFSQRISYKIAIKRPVVYSEQLKNWPSYGFLTGPYELRARPSSQGSFPRSPCGQILLTSWGW